MLNSAIMLNKSLKMVVLPNI